MLKGMILLPVSISKYLFMIFLLNNINRELCTSVETWLQNDAQVS